MRSGIWLPPAPFRARLLRRATLLWLLTRLTLLAMGAVGRGAPGGGVLDFLRLMPPTSAAVVALVAWMTLFDARRRHETVLLANLGVRPATLAALGAIPPLLLEVGTWCLP